MEAKLFGTYVKQDCPECLNINKSEYVVVKDTPCELLLSNTSNVRADIRIWMQNLYIGTWAIGGDNNISLLTFSNAKNDLTFSHDSVITVKFFQAIDNEISMDRKLFTDEVENVVTKILIIHVVDFSVYTIPESKNPYSLVL